jgi:histidinol phosphatase-like enzyme
MSYKLNKIGAYIDDYFYAVYHSSSKKKYTNKEKKLRKPDIGMIKLAYSKWKVIEKKSIVIGDNETDILMAKKANLKSYLVNEKTNLLNIVKVFHSNTK